MLFMSCACHAFASVYSALWSPVGKGLISWLSFVMFNCVFCHFPMWYPWSGVVHDCIVS